MHYFGAFVAGLIAGFLGGLFGKGGSAIATPLLALLGYPGFVAVASPLPATIPGTLLASLKYRESRLLDWEIVWWSVGIGVPATILGSFLTKFTGAYILLVLTGVMILGFGVSFLVAPREAARAALPGGSPEHSRTWVWHVQLVLMAAFVGFISGLLANAGGFLLAPGYARFLRLPLKKSFACSLAVSAAIAIPGTVVHAWLGHISWIVATFVACGSVPLSYLGAQVAIRTKAHHLERIYGIVLTFLGGYFLYKLR